MSAFYASFKENMESLGLPAPVALFGNLQAAVASAAMILGQIDKYGKTVTIGELIEVGTRLDALGMIAGCSAAFYAGAVIASIAVATNPGASGSTSLSDVLFAASKYQLDRPWLASSLQRWPGIHDRRSAARAMYRFYAVAA